MLLGWSVFGPKVEVLGWVNGRGVLAWGFTEGIDGDNSRHKESAEPVTARFLHDDGLLRWMTKEPHGEVRVRLMTKEPQFEVLDRLMTKESWCEVRERLMTKEPRWEVVERRMTMEGEDLSTGSGDQLLEPVTQAEIAVDNLLLYRNGLRQEKS